MPASWQTFTHAARHCSSVPYCCSNSASVSPCMIARIDPISCPSESILHRFRSGRKGGRLVDKRVWERSNVFLNSLLGAPQLKIELNFGNNNKRHNAAFCVIIKAKEGLIFTCAPSQGWHVHSWGKVHEDALSSCGRTVPGPTKPLKIV